MGFFESILSDFKFYRKRQGGIWYKVVLRNEISNPSYWTQHPGYDHRIEKIEDYTYGDSEEED